MNGRHSHGEDSELNRTRSEVERLQQMRKDELVDFIRDTVVRLDALADRLETYVSEEKDDVARRE